MSDLDANQKLGRLAFREEGTLWVAYYAMPGTMEDAIFLGSIRMAAAANPLHREAFIGLMKELVGDILEEKVGARPHWGSAVRAPEHERGGRA